MTARIQPLASTDLPALEDLVASAGYRPNALMTMAKHPTLLPAILQLVQSTARATGEVERELRTLLACEASRNAGCFYTTTHLAHSVHHQGVPLAKLADLDRYATSSHYTERERAALALATVGGTLPMGDPAPAFERARRNFSEAELLELVAAVATFGFFNRWNSLIGSELEDVPGELVEQVGWLQAMRRARQGAAA